MTRHKRNVIYGPTLRNIYPRIKDYNSSLVTLEQGKVKTIFAKPSYGNMVEYGNIRS